MRATQWILYHSDEPMLQQRSADGTPVNVRTVYKVQWENMSVTTHGRETSEYLIQRVLLTTLQGRPLVIFTEPTNMFDKTASSHMQSQRTLFPTAREVGHEGLLVDHQMYDRAVCSAMNKLWDAFDNAYYRKLAREVGAPWANRLQWWH